MSAYYNENDKFAAAWLRNLIAAGHIAPGDVDERSIVDVRPDDLRGYAQCHFFAGIGGWSYALRLSGWPDDRPVWTGSCPCQPFSVAGEGKGIEDERHLWPDFFRLIRESRPTTVFGEQVASGGGLGWLDLVCADLEEENYAVWAGVVGSHSVAAPHIRQRLYWLADADRSRSQGRRGTDDHQFRANGHPDALCAAGGRMADADGRHTGTEREQHGREQRQQPQDGGAGGLAHDGREGWRQVGADDAGRGVGSRTQGLDERPLHNGFWGDADWLACRDGKARPVEPGTFPLAHGVSARMGRLRGYGNAIVPQVAAEVIRAFMECKP